MYAKVVPFRVHWGLPSTLTHGDQRSLNFFLLMARDLT
jgi:hypothetical protein